MQLAGQMLWERRDRKERRIRKAAYAEIGGVVGALAHHADGVMDAMSPDEIQISRHLFLRLVTEDGARKVVQRSRLLHGLGESAGSVLDRLVETRAIVIRKGRRNQKGTPRSSWCTRRSFEPGADWRGGSRRAETTPVFSRRWAPPLICGSGGEDAGKRCGRGRPCTRPFGRPSEFPASPNRSTGFSRPDVDLKTQVPPRHAHPPRLAIDLR